MLRSSEEQPIRIIRILLGHVSGVICSARVQGLLGVNLRRERVVRTGPLNPKLPPLQTRPQAAVPQFSTFAERTERFHSRIRKILIFLIGCAAVAAFAPVGGKPALLTSMSR